jgi:hypothetical protein
MRRLFFFSLFSFAITSFANNNKIDKKQGGFYNYSTIGVMAGGNQAYYNSPFKLTFYSINGYRFDENFKIGVGLGCDYLVESFYYPITLSASINLLDKPSSPYIRVFGGFAKPFHKERISDNTYEDDLFFEGGLTHGFDIGMQNTINDNYSFRISAGYRYQKTSVKHFPNNSWNKEETLQHHINRLVLTAGFLFH